MCALTTSLASSTGAADNLIRLFKADKLVKTFKGHSQAVRALAKLDKSAGGGEGGDWFASGSNDGSVLPLTPCCAKFRHDGSCRIEAYDEA